jgi:NCAIR mutase (PurE)-related protein
MTDDIRQLLRDYKEGEVDEEHVLQRLVRQPFEEHMLGRFDHHREARTGIPEAILAEGKEPEEVADIFRTYLERGERLMATRVTDDILEALEELIDQLHHYDDAGIVSTAEPDPDAGRLGRYARP